MSDTNTDDGALTAKVNVDFDKEDAENVIRQKFTEASGKSDWTKATPANVTAFGEGSRALSDEILEAANIPDDALIERMVVDVENGVTVWYITEDDE